MELLILVCIIILFFSFLASSAEAALFSATPLQIEKMHGAKLSGAARLKNNKEKIQDSISAIVFLNNFANIAGSIIVGTLAGALFDHFWLGVFSAAFTFIIIFFGEIVPKLVGERFSSGYGRATAGIVYFIRILFKPMIFFVQVLTKPFGKSSESYQITRDEITLLAQLGRRHGAIQESEDRLIRQVIRLNDIPARDIMTPRTVVFALQADKTLQEVASDLYGASVSRIPVYEEDIDDVVGIVHIRDLLVALAKREGGKPCGSSLRMFHSSPRTGAR